MGTRGRKERQREQRQRETENGGGGEGEEVGRGGEREGEKHKCCKLNFDKDTKSTSNTLIGSSDGTKLRE